MDFDAELSKHILPWVIVIVNMLWGVLLALVIAFVKNVITNLKELNAAALTNAANLARVDTKVGHALARLETIGSRTHDLVQDVSALKAVMKVNSGD